MILRADWVVPITSPPISGGFVEVSGDTIRSFGRFDSLESVQNAIDLGHCILLPGLVNPHTHLELTGYAGAIPPGPFWPWIGQLVRLRRQPGAAERERAAVASGAWGSLRAGVTCVGDISRSGGSWKLLKEIPIRKVCFSELLSIAEAPPRGPAELLQNVSDVVEDDLLTAGISPHAPWSVAPGDVRAAIQLAQRMNRPWTMHFLETSEEAALIRGDTAGVPAMLAQAVRDKGIDKWQRGAAAYVSEVCGGDHGGALVHLNYADDAVIAELRRAAHTAVICPRAHSYFQHPPHPIGKLRSAGVRIALGTDSLASNDSLSPLDEVRFVSERWSIRLRDEEWLRMITTDAAAALGMAHRIGAIQPGYVADLSSFACPPDCADPLAHLISAAPPAEQVWVAGNRVV